MKSYIIQWNGAPVTVHYKADCSRAYRKSFGYRLAKLEIISAEPLPITETGYRSHFIRADYVEGYGGPVEFVRQWLDSAAQSPEWQKYIRFSRQLTLF